MFVLWFYEVGSGFYFYGFAGLNGTYIFLFELNLLDFPKKKAKLLIVAVLPPVKENSLYFIASLTVDVTRFNFSNLMGMK